MKDIPRCLTFPIEEDDIAGIKVLFVGNKVPDGHRNSKYTALTTLRNKPIGVLTTDRESLVFDSALESIHDNSVSEAEGLAIRTLTICSEDDKPTDITAIQQLLDLNANIETRDGAHATPLIVAAKLKSASFVAFLLSHGACIYARDSAGWSVLETAIFYDNHEVLDFLLTHYYRYRRPPRLIGSGVLRVAAEHADLETVKLLVEAAENGMHARNLDRQLLKTTMDVLRGRDDSSDDLCEAFQCLVNTVHGTAIEKEGKEVKGKGKMPAAFAAARLAIDLKIFDELEKANGASVGTSKLAKATGADASLIAERPEHLERFNNYMSGSRQGKPSWMDEGLYPVEARLSQGMRDARLEVFLVDIGGGIGHDLQELKTKHPKISGRLVLQDQPSVIDQIGQAPAGIELTVHNFFTPQPIKGARAYYLHSVLHDWDDASCLKILRNITSAMQIGYSKLLINENVVPDFGAMSSITSMDWLMMVSGAVKEQTEMQWRALLKEAGLRVVGIWTYEQGTESLIEAEIND
ncbi:hypothetical protein P7C71_g4466, partial [Lecanoromycetidae sp. Uapishka_2]